MDTSEVDLDELLCLQTHKPLQYPHRSVNHYSVSPKYVNRYSMDHHPPPDKWTTTVSQQAGSVFKM